MKISRNKIFFFLVILFFLATRLYRIGTLPASVYWDEASIGYNAYSIGTDLKDEWGSFLPLHFRAFGEFKLPVYIYSVVPFVKILGLNASAVRLPAVLYSLGTIVVTYLLVGKITGKKSAGIIASFLLTVSPWFFIFSRAGYEATAGLFFFLLGTYFLLFIDKRKIFVFLGVFSYILSFYSYNSFRIFVPVLLAIFAVYYLVQLKSKREYILVTLVSGAILLLILVPLYRLYRYDTGGLRFAEVQVTNKLDFFKNYFVHFSPEFLFTTGDTNPRSQIPGHGELFWVDIPFILLGLYAVYKKKSFLYLLPLLFILTAPIPAALTKESPHALRSLLAAPGFAILSTLGISYIAGNIKKYSGIFIGAALIAYYLSFEAYGVDFITKYQNLSASDWQYQYKEIFADQKNGVVTDKYGQPYIFALFYLKYPPQEFRSTVKYNPPDKWGFSLVSSFDDFQFKD
jgi:4-amino-4-deoxy-L-arabinose transferase-like glycosyltransferase